MSSGGKKKKKSRTLFDQATDVARVGVSLGMDEGARKRLEGDVKGAVYTASGGEAREKEARRIAKEQKELLEEQNRILEERNKAEAKRIADERKAAQDQLKELEGTERRKTARARQQAKARGAQGRRSTILTAGQLGESPRARKTLLGQ